MEPNIPTPINVPPSQRPQGPAQGIPGTPASTPVALPNVIRTMKMDAAEAATVQNETLVSMALAEEKKKAARQAEMAQKEASGEVVAKPAPKPIGRIVIILGLIVLIGGVGVAIKFALPTLRTINLPNISLPTFGTPGTGQSTGVAPVSPAAPMAHSLIPAQSEKRFIINKETPERLFSMVSAERTLGVTPGNIRNLYFAEETTNVEGKVATDSISANRLLLMASTPTPAILARSLETPFMAGLYGEEGSQATPFLVFKVSGYDTGLAGMLAWEKDLPHFFDALFGTKFLVAPSAPVKFHNTVVSGYDVRALEGLPAGSIFYAIANQNTIIITGARGALETLLPLLLAR